MDPKTLTKSKHRIFLVDDHAVVREGLKWIIERQENLEVCGEAADATETLERIKSSKPDVAIIDVALTGMSGIELTKSVRALYPKMGIIVLSMFNENLYAERAIRAGANGYIMKRDGGEKVISAIRHVLGGQTYVSDEFKEILLQKLGNSGSKPAFSMDLLSNRELDVLRLIGQGFGSKEIAKNLEISMKTVEAHREHIRAKLKMHTNSELVQHAIHWVHSENIPH